MKAMREVVFVHGCGEAHETEAEAEACGKGAPSEVVVLTRPWKGGGEISEAIFLDW